MTGMHRRDAIKARAAGELVADIDMLTGVIRRSLDAGGFLVTARELAEALVAAGFGRVDAARREITVAERRGAERALREAADDWRVQATSERNTRGNVGQVLLVVEDDLRTRAARLGRDS